MGARAKPIAPETKLAWALHSDLMSWVHAWCVEHDVPAVGIAVARPMLTAAFTTVLEMSPSAFGDLARLSATRFRSPEGPFQPPPKPSKRARKP